jgi:hypothetical protein
MKDERESMDELEPDETVIHELVVDIRESGGLCGEWL